MRIKRMKDAELTKEFNWDTAHNKKSYRDTGVRVSKL